MAASSSSSPPISPPSLLPSSFSSTADTPNNGPPTPHTPPRGRSRYPSSLAHDGLRVPLHRRGTSRTYERLEDLLKEAGYKETRIFTPETERHREHERGREEREPSGRVRSGVDTVVGFLAGLVSVQNDGQRMDIKNSQSDRATHTTLVDPSMHRHRIELDINPTIRVSPPSRTRAMGQSLRHSGVTNSGRSSDVSASPARVYLRHIASAPNIPRRRLLRGHTPIPGAKKSTTSMNHGVRVQGTPPPPMPSSWLETVTRAVLAFPGSRIGRRNDTSTHTPLSHPPDQSRSEPSSQTTSRSGTVRGRTRPRHPVSVLEDTAARLRGRSTPSLPTGFDSSQPPAILAMRSQVSIGQVEKINVVCRSAPASRSSSLARRKPRSDSPATTSLGSFYTGSVRGMGKARQTGSRNPRPKSGKDLSNRGPSLSVRLEDGSATLQPPGDTDDYDSTSEDEDEDEVDLSKLLVHPRRQESIKSLRRHLERTLKTRGVGVTTTTPNDRGRTRRGSVNDGDWGGLSVPGPESDSRTSQQRRAIPSSWMQRSGSFRR